MVFRKGHKLGLKHGHWGTPEYWIWNTMIGRCTNPKDRQFKNYGGRGIGVCERWRTFSNFWDDMCPRPEPRLELDRIDNDGNYEPGNVRWATRSQQMRNTRVNRIVEINGEKAPMIVWAERLGIKMGAVTSRLVRGWSDVDALTTTPMRRFSLEERTAVLERLKNGERAADIARSLGVTWMCIGLIKKRHLKGTANA